MPDEKKDTWIITVQTSVFAGDMDKADVISNAERQLEDLLDGTDFIGVSVIQAQRDE